MKENRFLVSAQFSIDKLNEFLNRHAETHNVSSIVDAGNHFVVIMERKDVATEPVATEPASDKTIKDELIAIFKPYYAQAYADFRADFDAPGARERLDAFGGAMIALGVSYVERAGWGDEAYRELESKSEGSVAAAEERGREHNTSPVDLSASTVQGLIKVLKPAYQSAYVMHRNHEEHDLMNMLGFALEDLGVSYTQRVMWGEEAFSSGNINWRYD